MLEDTVPSNQLSVLRIRIKFIRVWGQCFALDPNPILTKKNFKNVLQNRPSFRLQI